MAEPTTTLRIKTWILAQFERDVRQGLKSVKGLIVPKI